MDVIKDFLISTFFESALAFLWIGALIAAWACHTKRVPNPLRIASCAVKKRVFGNLSTKKDTVLYFVIPFVIFSYPIGVVMERVSDDFVETSSVWMPKPGSKTKYTPSALAPTDDIWIGGHFYNLIRRHLVPYWPERFGRDGKIKDEVLKKYSPLIPSAILTLKKGKTIRDILTRRAFGREASNSYLSRLLELVRICQAMILHSFLLFFVLINLSLILIIGSIQNRWLRWISAGLLVVILISWNLFAPLLHEPTEFNYPVFLIFFLIVIPLIIIVFKLCLLRKKPLVFRYACWAARPLFSLGLIALAFCYFSTFSWAEHRENYLEAAIILGAETSQTAGRVATGSAGPSTGDGEAKQSRGFEKVGSQEAVARSAAVIAGGFELSGSAVVRSGVLFADDDLIGAVLFVPDSSSESRMAKVVKIERKRGDSEPFSKLPHLLAIQDFEGIASDRNTAVFLVGSHNAKNGERRSDREFLLWADWDPIDRELKLEGQVRDLAERVTDALKRVGLILELSNTRIDSRLDIEGLAYSGGRLYIGLRGPLSPRGNALVLSAEAKTLFEEGKAVDLDIIELPLNGGGVRSIDFDPVSQSLLVLSGPSSDIADADPALWTFDANSQKLTLLHKFTAAELQRSQNSKDRYPEAVCRDSSGRIMVAFDGSEEGSPNVLLLDPDVK